MFSGGRSPTRANLGFSSAAFSQVDQLARRAILDGAAEKLWIGLDSGAFILDRPNPQPPLPAAGLSPRTSALLGGWISPVAWGDSLQALLSGACRDPITTPAGCVRSAPPGSSPDRARIGDERFQLGLIEGWTGTADEAASRVRARLRQLEELLRFAREHQTRIVLVLTPSHPRYHDLLRHAGMSALQGRWRASVFLLGPRYRATIVDADDPRFLAAAVGESCPSGRALSDCAFYDIAHARPAIGNAIIAEGNRREQGTPPSR